MRIINLYGISSQKPINTLGGLRIISGNDKFHDDLKVLLETKRGTLIGDPNFGSNLHTLLFLPATDATAQLIRDEVATCIDKYYTNITIVSIDVYFNKYSVSMRINYSISSGSVGNTVTLEFIKGGN